MLRLLAPWGTRKGTRAPRIEPFHYPYLDHYGRMRTDHEVQDELDALRDQMEARRYRNQIRELIRRSRWPSTYALESREPATTSRPSLEPERVNGH